MRCSVGLIAGLALAAAAADAGNNGIPLPELPEITVGIFLERHHDPGLLMIELRADRSISAVMFEAAQRPQAIVQSDIRANCLAVLIIDETSWVSEVVDAIDRFGGAGLAEPHRTLQPGAVPFIIPRGLCEPRDPVQIFN